MKKTLKVLAAAGILTMAMGRRSAIILTSPAIWL